MTNNAREDHDQIVTETLLANLRRVFGDREFDATDVVGSTDKRLWSAVERAAPSCVRWFYRRQREVKYHVQPPIRKVLRGLVGNGLAEGSRSESFRCEEWTDVCTDWINTSVQIDHLDYKIAYYTALLTVGHSAKFIRLHMHLTIDEFGSLAYAAERKACAELERVKAAVRLGEKPTPLRSERRAKQNAAEEKGKWRVLPMVRTEMNRHQRRAALAQSRWLTLYHFTTPANLPGIRRRGIVPFTREEHADLLPGIDVVWLTTNQEGNMITEKHLEIARRHGSAAFLADYAAGRRLMFDVGGQGCARLTIEIRENRHIKNYLKLLELNHDRELLKEYKEDCPWTIDWWVSRVTIPANCITRWYDDELEADWRAQRRAE
jgi:hypothetical protein